MHPQLPGIRLEWPRPVRGAARWVWSRRWARRLLILVAVWHLVGAIMLVLAPTAEAADGAASSTLRNLFGWMNIKDSHGINSADYYLSIDEGGATSPIKAVWAWIINLEYNAYRGVVMIAIWFIKQALSFKWLDMVTSPISDIADAVTSLTGQLHMRPLMLTLAGFAVALWLFRGRYATGLYELLMSLIIAAGVLGFLANPVATLAGDDGLISKAKDYSLEVATGIGNDGNTNGNPDAQIDDLTGQLTDTFIRQPTQLLNFGRVLDTSKQDGAAACVKAFDEAYLKKPPERSTLGEIRDSVEDIPLVGGAVDSVLPGGDDAKARVRDAVGKCPGGEQMKDYAENPGPEQAIASMFLIPAAGLVFLFALYLAGRVVLATVVALWNGVKLIPGGLLGIAPMFRTQLMRSLADVAMALLQVCFAVIFTCAYCIIITSVFDKDDVQLMATVLIADVLILIALVMFRKGMLGLNKWSDRLTEIMSRRPGASPVAVKQKTAPSAHEMLARAQAVKHGYNTARKVGGTVGKVVSGGGQAVAAVGTGGASAVAATAAKIGAEYAATQTAAAVAAKLGESTSGARTADDVPATDAPAASSGPAPVPMGTGGGSATSSPDDTRRRSQALYETVTKVRDIQNRPLNPTGTSAPPIASARGAVSAATRPSDARSATDRVRSLAEDNRSFRPRTSADGTQVWVPTPRAAGSPSPRRTPAPPAPTPPAPRPAPPARDAARRAGGQVDGPQPTSVR